MTEPGTVRVERPEPAVAILRLHRPAQLNALNTSMFGAIRSACEELHADTSVRAVMLTGAPGLAASIRREAQRLDQQPS